MTRRARTYIALALAAVGLVSAQPAAAVTVTPGTLTFGPQASTTASPTQALTVTNDGATPVTFSRVFTTGGNSDDFFVASDGCTDQTIGAGASCEVLVRFFPSAPGPRTTTLRIRASDGEIDDVTLNGTATAEPAGATGPGGTTGTTGATGATGATAATGDTAAVVATVLAALDRVAGG